MSKFAEKEFTKIDRENKIILNHLTVDRNRVSYDYTVIGPWKECFRPDREFFVEFSEDFQKNIPYSVAVTPFLGNFLPISWVYNAEIVIESIDHDFLTAIEEIKRSYRQMYPEMIFRGKLTFDNVVESTIDPGVGRSALYFSGGVDAFSSLVNIFSEDPILISVWGTDVYMNDTEGWEVIRKNTEKTAKQFGLSCLFIKSSFRDAINYNNLNKKIVEPVSRSWNWWYEFQHGLALLSLSAPIAFDKNIRRVYLSSTYNAKSVSPHTVIASYPTIDNNYKNAGTRGIHEGFENTRQDKIRKICRFFSERKQKIFLHVCWVVRDGSNCCRCEKCARTIFGIMAEGYDPADYGFPLTKEKYQILADKIRNGGITPYPVYWEDSVKGLFSQADKPSVKQNPAVKAIFDKTLDTIDISRPFYPTEYRTVERASSNVVLFREEFVGRADLNFKSVFGNTGNIVFEKALQSILNLTTTSFNNALREELRPSHIITTDLIWIRPESNFDYLLRQMNKFRDSVFVPISVGLQAPKMGSDFRLNDSVLNVLKAIEERAVIGCRGVYTAEILNKNGIKNVEVIGCPSVYYRGKEGYHIKTPDITTEGAHVVSNFRSFWGKLSKIEKHFLSYCATGNFDFVEQAALRFELRSTDNDKKYFDYVNRWMSKKSRTFFDIDSWNSFVSLHNFSWGARFHGNVLALWNDIPALFMPVDSRTAELVDFFRLPSVPMENFDREKPLRYYIEKADYTDFNKLYPKNYRKFVGFLKKNGLEVS